MWLEVDEQSPLYIRIVTCVEHTLVGYTLCVYVCVCTRVCPFSQVVHLDDYCELLQYIDKSGLTSDLGGSLVYDHQEWVKYRLVSARAAAAL